MKLRSSSPLKAFVAITLASVSSLQAQSFWPIEQVIPNNIGMQLKGNTEDPATLDQVKALGMKWVRRGFIWEAVEKEKGVYDFTKYDAFVKNCKDRGLSIIGCIAFSNKLYSHAKDEPGRSGYAAFAAALAARYKNEAIVWEIWNEPNTMTFWGKHGKKGNSEPYAEEYLSLVKATVPAMKKANPNCIVLAGSVSNLWTESYKWMGFIFQKGILREKFDGWSVHPYGLKVPEDYTEAYAVMHKQIKDAGGPANITIINTERGFPVKKAEGFAGGDENKTFEYQAWFIVRQYLMDMLEGVKLTIWYEWGGKEGFAIYADGKPNPAYNAAKVMIEQLNGYRLENRIKTESDRDYVLQFKNANGAIKLVAWTAPPKGQGPDKTVDHPVKIPVNANGALQTAQIYGEAGTVPVESGAITLTLTGAPQYVTVSAK